MADSSNFMNLNNWSEIVQPKRNFIFKPNFLLLFMRFLNRNFSNVFSSVGLSFFFPFMAIFSERKTILPWKAGSLCSVILVIFKETSFPKPVPLKLFVNLKRYKMELKIKRIFFSLNFPTSSQKKILILPFF